MDNQKFCSNCDAPNPREAAFCNQCGKQFHMEPCGKDYCLPVYLDMGAVQTVYNEVVGLASLSEEIERKMTSSADVKKSVGIGGGVKVWVVDAKAEGSQEKTDSKGVEETSKAGYVRTCQALFDDLRKALFNKGLVKPLADGDITAEELKKLSEYEFVELSAHVYPNPIIRTLSVMTELTSLSTLNEKKDLQPKVLSDLLHAHTLPAQTQAVVDVADKKAKEANVSHDATSGTSKTDTPASLDVDLKDLKKSAPSLSRICNTLNDAEVKLFVAYLTNLINPELENVKDPLSYPVVMTLFKKCARDESMIEISDRQFRILGKVVRNWEGKDSVDLLRGTKYNGLGIYLTFNLVAPYFNSMAAQLVKKLQNGTEDKLSALGQKDVLKAQFGWNPLKSLTIQAPALEIVPLALYV
ncbi:MAG: DUF6414 family protein [Halobacteriota archaeon]